MTRDNEAMEGDSEILVIRSGTGDASVRLAVVSRPDSPSDDWCLSVEVGTPDVTCRNSDVWFLQDEVTAFVVALAGIERLRQGKAALNSIGEGSDAQELRLSLSCDGPTKPIVVSVALAKLHYVGGSPAIDRCITTFALSQESVLTLVESVQAVFAAPYRRFV